MILDCWKSNVYRKPAGLVVLVLEELGKEDIFETQYTEGYGSKIKMLFCYC